MFGLVIVTHTRKKLLDCTCLPSFIFYSTISLRRRWEWLQTPPSPPRRLSIRWSTTMFSMMMRQVAGLIYQHAKLLYNRTRPSLRPLCPMVPPHLGIWSASIGHSEFFNSAKEGWVVVESCYSTRRPNQPCLSPRVMWLSPLPCPPPWGGPWVPSSTGPIRPSASARPLTHSSGKKNCPIANLICPT